MTHNHEQNGRQQSQLCNSNKQRHQWLKTKTPSSEQPPKICRAFLWGICIKGAQCKFRHDLDVESMKSIVVFCNDFQNRIGCNRPDCSYIHATREEKELFLTAGKIPRALAERHFTISTVQISAPEGSVPMGFVPEAYKQLQAPPPPPPPPEAVESATPAPPPPMGVPAPPPTAVLPLTLAPPPPALPPPPPPTVGTITPRMPAMMYPVPPPQVPQNSTTPMGFLTQPPPPPLLMPADFDASKPPPLLTNGPSQNHALKRSSTDTLEAGPSKMKKAESIRDVDSLCDNCVQREIRIEMYRQQMQKLHLEEEYQSLLYKKKLEEYETGREMLKSAIAPQLFRVIDHYFENSSQEELGNNLLAHCSQMLPSTLPASNLIHNNAELHSIMAAAQTTKETNNTASSVFQSFLEALRDKSAVNNNHNKYQSIVASRGYLSGGTAPTIPNVANVAQAPATATTTTYLPFQSAVPPPTSRPYQTFTTTNTNGQMNNPNVPQARMAAPPAAALPTTSACTPAPPLHPIPHNGVTYTQQYSTWRYPPQPPFYPPQ